MRVTELENDRFAPFHFKSTEKEMRKVLKETWQIVDLQMELKPVSITSHPRIAHGQRYPMPYLE